MFLFRGHREPITPIYHKLESIRSKPTEADGSQPSDRPKSTMSQHHGATHNLIKSGTHKTPNRHSHLALPVALCLLACILSTFQPVSAILTTCYDPSGNVRQDVPCYQNAVNSFCCGQGWGTNQIPRTRFMEKIKEILIKA